MTRRGARASGRRSARIWPGVLAAFVLASSAVLLGAGPASAHASLVASTPTSGSVVEAQPREVSLTFSEPVEATADSLRVTGPDGAVLTDLSAATDPRNRARVVARLPDHLDSGTYRVGYRVLSIDGHVVHGEIRFAFRTASGSLSAAKDDTGATGPSTSVAAFAALGVGGALAVTGLVGYCLIIVRPARRRLPPEVGAALERESRTRLRVPLLIALGVAVLGAVLTAVESADQIIGSAGPGDLVSFLTSTRSGVLISLRVVLLCLAVGTMLVVPRMLVGLGAATAALVTMALSSHAAAFTADQAVAVGFATVHLVAVGLWIGGLLGLALAGVGAARAAGGRSKEAVGNAVSALARSFSTAAMIAMLVVLTTGGYLALLQVSAVHELTDTSWGQALVVKLALWVTLLMFAAVNALVVVPRMSDRAARASQRLTASGDLSSAMRLELLLGAALIVAASAMASSPPPDSVARTSAFAEAAAKVSQDPRTSTATASGSGYDVRVVTTRTGNGPTAATSFRVLLSSQGEPASSPHADARLVAADGSGGTLALQIVGAGQWVSERLAVTPGPYDLEARFLRGGAPVTVPIKVVVP